MLEIESSQERCPSFFRLAFHSTYLFSIREDSLIDDRERTQKQKHKMTILADQNMNLKTRPQRTLTIADFPTLTNKFPVEARRIHKLVEIEVVHRPCW